jgi:hypothetical protein
MKFKPQSLLKQEMDLSGQLHDPAVLLPGKECGVNEEPPWASWAQRKIRVVERLNTKLLGLYSVALMTEPHQLLYCGL